MAITICALFTIALIGANVGRVDIYAIASGRTQPIGRTKVVQPLEDGKISRILVAEGDAVAVGQPLIDLDGTELTADEKALALQRASLEGEIDRRRAEIAAARTGQLGRSWRIPSRADVPDYIRKQQQTLLDADIQHLRADVSLLRAKADEDEAKIAGLALSLSAEGTLSSVLRSRLSMRTGLQRDGWDTQSNVLDAAEDLEKENTSMAADRSTAFEARAALNTARKQLLDSIAQSISDNSSGLTDAQKKLDDVSQSLIKAGARVGHTRLVAPVAGTVQQLSATTVGQVLTTGQQVLTIVPNGSQLEIRALVENRDIGFVHVGDKVVIKVDSFPFTRYGTINGRVSALSKDAVSTNDQLVPGDTEDKPTTAENAAAAPTPRTQDLVFPVTIIPEQTYLNVDGKQTPLTAGMSVTAEIKTGTRTVLNFIMSPLVATIAGAGHER